MTASRLTAELDSKNECFQLKTKMLNQFLAEKLVSFLGTATGKKGPRCLISYAIGDAYSEHMVTLLKPLLLQAKCDVVLNNLDVLDARFGRSLVDVISEEFEKADYVLMIGSEKYWDIHASKRYSFAEGVNDEVLKLALVQFALYYVDKSISLYFGGSSLPKCHPDISNMKMQLDFNKNFHNGFIALVEHVFGITKGHCEIYEAIYNLKKLFSEIDGSTTPADKEKFTINKLSAMKEDQEIRVKLENEAKEKARLESEEEAKAFILSFLQETTNNDPLPQAPGGPKGNLNTNVAITSPQSKAWESKQEMRRASLVQENAIFTSALRVNKRDLIKKYSETMEQLITASTYPTKSNPFEFRVALSELIKSSISHNSKEMIDKIRAALTEGDTIIAAKEKPEDTTKSHQKFNLSEICNFNFTQRVKKIKEANACIFDSLNSSIEQLINIPDLKCMFSVLFSYFPENLKYINAVLAKSLDLDFSWMRHWVSVCISRQMQKDQFALIEIANCSCVPDLDFLSATLKDQIVKKQKELRIEFKECELPKIVSSFDFEKVIKDLTENNYILSDCLSLENCLQNLRFPQQFSWEVIIERNDQQRFARAQFVALADQLNDNQRAALLKTTLLSNLESPYYLRLCLYLYAAQSRSYLVQKTLVEQCGIGSNVAKIILNY